MGTYIAKRLAISIPVLFLISVGAFILVHLTPGDPADMYITPDMTPAQIEMTRAALGLDKPVIVGAANAVDRLTDGTVVTVDCVRGLVCTMP